MLVIVNGTFKERSALVFSYFDTGYNTLSREEFLSRLRQIPNM